MTNKALPIYSSGTVVLLVALMHYVLSLAATSFQQVYAGFGEELPALARILVFDSSYYWIVPIALACALIAHHLDLISRPLVILTCCLGTIGSVIVWFLGIYQPIFQMGAVIGQ